MPRRRTYTTRNAYRPLTRIREKAQERAETIGRYIITEIRVRAPYDDRTQSGTTGPHLRDSYYVRVDEDGSVVIKCRRRYWAYVEFGTGHGRAQPHVRPSLEAAKRRFQL